LSNKTVQAAYIGLKQTLTYLVEYYYAVANVYVVLTRCVVKHSTVQL